MNIWNRDYFLKSRSLVYIISIFFIAIASNTWAVCNIASPLHLETNDGSAAKLRFGNVQLRDQAIQPLGSIVASTVVPPTEFRGRNSTAESILWICDVGDQDHIVFLVATNGDDYYGGHSEVASSDTGGQLGVFYTYARLVGLRLTVGGKTINKYYQDVPVTAYDTGDGSNGCALGKICIRLRHVPSLQAELIRIQTFPEVTGRPVTPQLSDGQYSYAGPAAYIQLSNKTNGVGPQPVTFGHDEIGEDSQFRYQFWGVRNGFGYTLYRAVSISPPTNSCLTTFVTPVVNFPTTSAINLNDGAQLSADFDVHVECHNSARRGIASGQNAIGLQVSSSTYATSQSLGLVNASNGVSALISDNYLNNANLAQNVGVYLSNPVNNAAMNFVGQPGLTGSFTATTGTGCTGACYPAITYPNGNSAGWYSVAQNAVVIGTPNASYTQYRVPFRATLKKLTTGPVTPGAFYATATVLVKIQ
jgi:hypothetical protein